MITVIDDFLMNLAKKIVNFFAFWGIDRKQLLHFWSVASWFCFYAYLVIMSSKTFEDFHSIGLLYLVLYVTTVGMEQDSIKRYYREDDILPNIPGNSIQNRIYMIFIQIMIILLSITIAPNKYYFAFILPPISPIFTFYFFLCQNPKNPLRLRNLVKNALGKIKQALKPAPQPQHQPQPSYHPA